MNPLVRFTDREIAFNRCVPEVFWRDSPRMASLPRLCGSAAS